MKRSAPVEHLRLLFLFSALAVGVLANTSSSQAQFDPDDPTFVGVGIDAQGLVDIRKPTADPRLRAQQKRALLMAMRQAKATGGKDELTYISLPRLFAEVRSLVKAGKPIPNDLKYLKGMTKLRYIFVFPEENDLVIAGDAEPYDAEFLNRPFGLRTRRPVLQLDDLVVALRLVGPGNGRNLFGCSIDPQNGAMQKVNAIIQNPANRRLAKSKKAQMMAEAVGEHQVRYFGMAPDSRIAQVVVEADYMMKRLAMGIDPPPIPALRRAAQGKKLQFNGLWFAPNYEPLLVSEDGNAYEIRGQSIRLNPHGINLNKQQPPSPGTKAFAENFTKYYPQLAEKVTAFADLWNVTDLALFAALVGHDNLHKKVNWDISWLLSGTEYPLPKLNAPRTAATLAQYRSGYYVVGGVGIEFANSIGDKNREVDSAKKVIAKLARPDKDAWTVVK